MTWSDRQLSVPKHPVMGTPEDNPALTAIVDPSIDSYPSGNPRAGYIARAGYSTTNGLLIERSIDMGNSWSGPSTIALNLRPVGPADPNDRDHDRPDMMADVSGNVLVAWIRDLGMTTPTGDIYFVRSGPPSATSIANPTGLDFTAVGGLGGSQEGQRPPQLHRLGQRPRRRRLRRHDLRVVDQRRCDQPADQAGHAHDRPVQ